MVMDPWIRQYYNNSNPNFFGAHMGKTFTGFPYQQSPFNSSQFPFQQQQPFPPFQNLPQYPQQPYPLMQPQPQQPFPPFQQQPDFLAPFKKDDGKIDFKKVGDGVQQVVGVANQIGPVLKTFGLIK